MPKAKEIEEQEPRLFPVSCPFCGKFIADLMEGAEALCCGQWWKAKSPEQKQSEIEKQKKKRFALIGKKKGKR
jgi:hypothetical protein